ncbi:MAG: family 10 glycosylhydrolase, partial [Candidatus Marinimicrobia bacterium]|nr:family 10 glycosylhydrolase [Candidatus Neomarinimicrobiota bacterium]
MKKVGLVLLIMLFAISLFGQTDNKEFRATWSITWHQFWSGGSVDNLKARTREILDNHKKANMNAVLWHVRQGGTVYYPSSIEPWGSYLGYADPGYDPLEYAINEAHKRGMELHAWFNTFAASSTTTGAPAQVHPEWVCRDQSGSAMTSSRALSPGLQDVREYTVNLAMEIVNNYDVDGIHFDYVRWNEYSSGSSSILLANKAEDLGVRQLDGMWTESEIQTLKSAWTSPNGSRYLYDVNHTYNSGVPSGYTSWENWWRGSTDKFIEAVHDSVQVVKPWVKVSIAALGKYKAGGWNGYYTVYQNSAKWFNEGWVDLMTPMHYHWTDADGFYNELKDDWEPNITQAISDGRIYSVGPGSYNFGSNWDNHPSVVAKVRTISWVDGQQFFSYGSWKDHQYWDEAGETFYSKNTKQKPATFLHSATPTAPSMSFNKLDSFNYEIIVTPDGSISENQWFILYRDVSNSVDVNSSDIVG